MKLHTQQRGFTIIELLIATTVFSTILLLCTMGIIQVGRIYYKGIIVSRTQETARNIANELSQAIQFSGGEVEHIPDGTHGEHGFCIGATRYSYQPFTQYKGEGSGHVLVRKTGVNNCQSTIADVNDGVELMGVNMRLDTDTLVDDSQSPVDNLWQVEVPLLYGDDDLFTSVDPRDGSLEDEKYLATITDGGDVIRLDHYCKASRLGGQFCAKSPITFVAQKRIQ